MVGYLWHIWEALFEIIKHLIKSYILQIPIAYPGDALEYQQTRLGDWPSRKFPVHGKWKFAVDEASHAISERQTPGVKMTGESAGRQIWYQEEKENGADPSVDAATVMEEFCPAKNPNASDLLFRKLMLDRWKGEQPSADAPKTAKEAAHKGMAFFQMLQTEDGHWAGDYGGPLFLLPGLVCALYLTKTPYPAGRREGMIVYLKNHQQTDGGWGSHIECASTMFGTVLSYVALRLLGEAAEAPYMAQARTFMHTHGGALYAPSWAKFWLALIGVYHWDGINSIPAEMWVLPKWVPLHPSQFWCHCRMIYLPMCYLYCKRYSPDVSSDPLLQALRREIYLESEIYDKINWEKHRQSCADIDEYTPLNPVIKVAQDILSLYERILPYLPPLRMFREHSLKFVLEYIHAEDSQTNYLDIGPVSKALNMLSVFVACGAESTQFQRHIARVDDYIWVAEDGVKMQGYNGSQCWDTAFTARAVVEAGLAQEFPECTRKMYHFLDRAQIRRNEEQLERYFRHPSKGGWPFSTAAHGWPISDCTSEALKGVLAIHAHDNAQHSTTAAAATTTTGTAATTATTSTTNGSLSTSTITDKDSSSEDTTSSTTATTCTTSLLIPLHSRISESRLCDACDVLLSYQNPDGGWASYENNRGARWYELFNPSSVFADIMIDYSYVECSSASIAALKDFTTAVPHYRAAEIRRAIELGRGFILSIQRPDGSWYGSWANCFTYGTWFGIEGLVSAGASTASMEGISKAVAFLLNKQNENGGWGESHLACINKAYPADSLGKHLGEGGSGVVQTAWALLGLLAGNCQDQRAMSRARDYLMNKQLPSGDWAQENITGIFSRSTGITYTAYRNLFPMWALARYAQKWERLE